MTSKLNLTAAKIRRFLLVTALVICPFIALQSGKAQDTVSATLLTSGGNNFITIAQGGSFSFTLAVTTNFNSLGYTVFLATNAMGNGQFQIDGRMNLSAVFTDPTTPDPTALGNPNGILGNPFAGNFANFRDLGYTGDGFTFMGPGMFSLATYTISNIGMMAPGTYTIFLDPRSIMTDPGFNDVNMGGMPMFTVTVIPEPTTVGLAILGGAALLVVARRKLGARA